VSAVQRSYSDIERERVIAEYAVLGSQKQVSVACGVPHKTVNCWINSEWGQELLAQIRIENQQEFIAGYTKIVRTNLEAQNDRLLHGDVVGTDEDGNELRQAVRYRDLVVGAGIAVDKIRLLSNQATSITATDGTLARIADQLAQYTTARKEKVIATQDATDIE